MRISDLSSDVCSSDLVGLNVPAYIANLLCAGRGKAIRKVPAYAAASRDRTRTLRGAARHSGRPGCRSDPDRTSVVEGKRVAVRVDRGVRSILNTEIDKNTTYMRKEVHIILSLK